MYIIIPLVSFLIAVALIILIIARKFVYLKKLTPETIDETIGSHENFLVELFPELTTYLKKVSLRSYGVNLLTEFEKLLRKLRLISMKVDTVTNQLIHRVRKEAKQQEAILSKEATLEEEKLAELESEEEELENLGDSQEDLKKKEQLLIIEIAKNPKDPQLYLELGNIYMRVGEYEDAKNSFAKAVELNPDDNRLKRKLSRAISKLQKFPPV